MEKAKYLPEEVDRMIDEEISRIDAANSRVAAEDAGQGRQRRSPFRRIADFLRARFKRHGPPLIPKSLI